MSETSKPRRRWWLLAAFFLAGAVLTVAVLALLFNIFERKQEAGATYTPVVAVDDTTVDAATWGKNFPLQYEGWKATSEMPAADKVPHTPTAQDPRTFTSPSKLEADPRLVKMWQGYAFAIDYREPRGHSYMLIDQRTTRRVLEKPQPGACLNCHASTYTIMNDLGKGDAKAGFDAMNKMTYADATKLAGDHPVGCIDCHDPKTMQLRVTRPAFVEGVKEYKASVGIANFDVNKDATTEEMRTYVCAQCHVEYYFKGEGKTLTFPWDNGLTVDGAYKYYQDAQFTDFTHKLTGASILKAQHPDFETWSNGIHASAGVTCADCHMPYTRVGSTKISDHQVRSPLENINTSCQACHKADAEELKGRVDTVQTTYNQAKNTSFDALVALIDDIEKAQASGTPADRLDLARAYQRKAQFFLDYSVSENSQGFHAPQYSIRVLNDVTDNARKGQLALLGVVTTGPTDTLPGGSSGSASATAGASAPASASATASPSASASTSASSSATP